MIPILFRGHRDTLPEFDASFQWIRDSVHATLVHDRVVCLDPTERGCVQESPTAEQRLTREGMGNAVGVDLRARDQLQFEDQSLILQAVELRQVPAPRCSVLALRQDGPAIEAEFRGPYCSGME